MVKKPKPEFLLADIGGTHSRLACLGDEAMPAHIGEFDNARFEDLPALIAHYLQQLPADSRPSAAVLAVAAPVEGDRVTLTNINWAFSTAGLQEETGFEPLYVINDFAALALAIPDLRDTDRTRLWGGEPVEDAPRAVIGPGTGLGVGTLVPHRENWLAVPGEGGHVTLPAVTEEEHALIEMLRSDIGHVSAERLLCGPGLELLYRTLARQRGRDDIEELRAETISKLAIEGTDTLARETLDMFFAMLGTVSGNLALTVGARGGVYLAGGILPYLAEQLPSSGYHRRFVDKGRYRDYLLAIPVYLVTARNPALTGLCRFVRQLTK